jgi:hypothetical protein
MLPNMREPLDREARLWAIRSSCFACLLACFLASLLACLLAKLMTEKYVFSSAPGCREKSVLSAALLAALRCTHVMVDNPDIDVEYR